MTKIGCHVSIAGGIENAPKRASALGCECFQLFTRSPRGGKVNEINAAAARKFLAQCRQHGYESGKDYVIHSPYFINLASSDNRIYYGSISALRKELETASLINAPYVITHLGSSKDLNGSNFQKQVDEKVLKSLKKIHDGYQGTAMLVLEIAAGSGNIIGDSLGEIGYLIENASKAGIRLGFCLDTCHAFAAGYDLRTPQKVKAVFADIKNIIGLQRLKCIHFNDSLTTLNSRKDRHEHIGKGEIGEQGLKSIVGWAQKLEVHLYLETKHDKIKDDLKITKAWRNEHQRTRGKNKNL